MRAPYTNKAKKYFEELKMGIKESDRKITVELDWEFIEAMAQRMDSNKDKYPRGNWKEPIDIELLEDALMRHWFAYKRGESSENHLVAIALNAMMIEFQKKALSLNLPPEKEYFHSKWIEDMSKLIDMGKQKPYKPNPYKQVGSPFNKPSTTHPPYRGKSELEILFMDKIDPEILEKSIREFQERNGEGIRSNSSSQEKVDEFNPAKPLPKKDPTGIWVDPPSGWKYGFPKLAPYPLPADMIQWVLDRGYPQSEIDILGTHFYLQFTESYD